MQSLKVMQEQFELVIRDNHAFIERRADQRLVGALTPIEVTILKMLADGIHRDEVEEMLHEAVPLQAKQLLLRVESRFHSLLQEGRGIHIPFTFEELDTTRPLEDSLLRDIPGPKVLHWWVTRYCNRRCVYCFAEPFHGGHAPDATITRAELHAVFQESATLGCERVLIAGGEPFLRQDLPEVLGDAIACGITPLITTKFPIDEALASRLATAGIKRMSVSFETASPETAMKMVGSRRFPEQVEGSIRHLASFGIRVTVQFVATRLNFSEIEPVARLASTNGASRMQVIPFEAVRIPQTGLLNEEMLLPPDIDLNSSIQEIATRFPQLQLDVFEKDSSPDRTQFHCDIGKTKLFMLPNGVVHRCYKLLDDTALIGKDLRQVSVAEAWHDPKFGRLIQPARSRYKSTNCENCSGFESCNTEGRCIYESLVSCGSYFDRDRSCSGPFQEADLSATV